METLQPLVLHVREGQPLQLSVQQVQQMTWQELARLWKASLKPPCMQFPVLSCLATCKAYFDLSPLQSPRRMLDFLEAHMKGYFVLGSY